MGVNVRGLSKFFRVRGGVISWVTGLLQYNARQFITLLQVHGRRKLVGMGKGGSRTGSLGAPPPLDPPLGMGNPGNPETLILQKKTNDSTVIVSSL